MLSFVAVPFTNGSPMGMGKMTNFFHPYTSPPIFFLSFFLRIKVGFFFFFFEPALAGQLVRGELWGCAQSLESVVPTSENKSLSSPRFLEAEIRDKRIDVEHELLLDQP